MPKTTVQELRDRLNRGEWSWDEVRTWAQANNVPVTESGAIRKATVEAYIAAHPNPNV